MFKATGTPQYKLASTAVGMVLGGWWGLRHPRRLTVLAIASESYTVVFYVPWVARAGQQRLNRSGNSRPAAAPARTEHRETDVSLTYRSICLTM